MWKDQASETKSLWLQQKVKSKAFYLRKVDKKMNPADLGTKPLQGPAFELAVILKGCREISFKTSLRIGMLSH